MVAATTPSVPECPCKRRMRQAGLSNAATSTDWFLAPLLSTFSLYFPEFREFRETHITRHKMAAYPREYLELYGPRSTDNFSVARAITEAGAKEIQAFTARFPETWIFDREEYAQFCRESDWRFHLAMIRICAERRRLNNTIK